MAPLESIEASLSALGHELANAAHLIIPADRHAALHEALDGIDSVLDSFFLRCGDCGERMSEAEVMDHVCGGRYETLRCGDCGEPVDSAVIADHVCSMVCPVASAAATFSPPSTLVRRSLSSFSSGTGGRSLRSPHVLRRTLPRRQLQAPYSLKDVHARVQGLRLEIAAANGNGHAPWWEVTTPDALEELEAAVVVVRNVVDTQFLKCGDCFMLLDHDAIDTHVCRGDLEA